MCIRIIIEVQIKKSFNRDGGFQHSARFSRSTFRIAKSIRSHIYLPLTNLFTIFQMIMIIRLGKKLLQKFILIHCLSRQITVTIGNSVLAVPFSIREALTDSRINMNFTNVSKLLAHALAFPYPLFSPSVQERHYFIMDSVR